MAEVVMRERRLHGEFFACEECGHETMTDKPLTLELPYCGSCGKSIDNASHNFCGWCGEKLEFPKEDA